MDPFGGHMENVYTGQKRQVEWETLESRNLFKEMQPEELTGKARGIGREISRGTTDSVAKTVE